MQILTSPSQGTVASIVIPQAGLHKDVLPTVTAVISATPNLGGVLGVGIIGTGMPNELLLCLPIYYILA